MELKCDPPFRQLERELPVKPGTYVIDESGDTYRIRTVLDRESIDTFMASSHAKVEEYLVTSKSNDDDCYWVSRWQPESHYILGLVAEVDQSLVKP